MKVLSIVVSDKTAREIMNLAHKGRITAKNGYDAYCLALATRPMDGERWVRIEGFDSHEGKGFWMRLPKRVTYAPHSKRRTEF